MLITRPAAAARAAACRPAWLCFSPFCHKSCPHCTPIPSPAPLPTRPARSRQQQRCARVRPVFRLLPVAQRPPVPFDGGSTRPSACPWAPRAPSCANSACIRPAPLARKADFIAPFGTSAPRTQSYPAHRNLAVASLQARHLCSRCPFPALCPRRPFLGPLLANVPPTCNCTLQSSISI